MVAEVKTLCSKILFVNPISTITSIDYEVVRIRREVYTFSVNLTLCNTRPRRGVVFFISL